MKNQIERKRLFNKANALLDEALCLILGARKKHHEKLEEKNKKAA